MISKRTEISILITILLFVLILSLIPTMLYSPFQNTYSFDFWAYLIRVQQYDMEGYINYYVDYSNVWRLEGGSTFYPPGFSLFLYSIYSLSGTSIANLGFVTSFMWVFFCFILYLLARKAFNSGQIGLISAFFGGTLISGSNMLGPIFPHPSVFSLLFILLTLLVLMILKGEFAKIFIPPLLLCVVFLSHRPSTLIWVLFIPFMIFLPLLFIKEKRRFIITFGITIINVTLLAMLISLLHWGNMPIDVLMRGGGIFKERLDLMFGLEFTKQTFVVMVSILSSLFIGILPLITPSWNAENYPQLKPICEIRISQKQFHLMTLIIPILFISLLGLFIMTSNSTSLNPITIWGSLSSDAHVNTLTDTIKKILYVWHINIIPLILLPPSIYLLMKSNRRHSMSAISISIIVSLIFIFLIESELFEVKIQRVYLYLAPFIFMVSGWGTYYYLKHYKMNTLTKIAPPLAIALSIALLLISIPSIASPLSDNRVETIYWTEYNVMDDEIIGTESLGAYARATGQFNYVTMYGIVSIQNTYYLIDYIESQGTAYVFIDGKHYQDKLQITHYYCVYQDGSISGFYTGGW